MQTIKTLLILSLCLYHLHPFAQVTVEGSLLLGDTTQRHLLYTQRGDVLAGRCLGWSGDSLFFQLKQANRLAMATKEVRLLKIDSGKAPKAFEQTGTFVLTTTTGETYVGHPENAMGDLLKFRIGRNNLKKIPIREVASLRFEPADSMDTDGTLNKYKLTKKKGNPIVGSLMGLKGGNFFLEGADGPDSLFFSYMASLKRIKPYRAAMGFSRASFLSPTGFNLPKGHREFRNLEYAVFNIVSVGVTDHFSVGLGGFAYIPYLDTKFSYDFGRYLHASAGLYAVVPLNFGWHSSLSIGTPDYFVNLAYVKSYEYKPLASGLDFDVISMMASVRIASRKRFFMEYSLIDEHVNEFEGFDYTNRGARSAFSWGFGWYSRRTRLELGWMLTGPTYFSRCSSIGPCGEAESTRFASIPVFALGVEFTKKRNRRTQR